MRTKLIGAAACALATAGLTAFMQQDDNVLRATTAPPDAVWVDALDLSKASAPRPIRAGQSVRSTPLSLGGVTYPHGLGASSGMELWIDLDGLATRFTSLVGIDDGRKANPQGVPYRGSVIFEVWLDGRKAADSGIIKAGDPPKQMTVDLAGAKRMILVVGDAGDGPRDDDADWAGALVFATPGKSSAIAAAAIPIDPPPPIASGSPDAPRINNPRITGGSPGRPFLFRIPATGKGPLSFQARNLPPGLALDRRTGIISGVLKAPARTVTRITVTGPAGSASADFTIVAADRALAQTPPLGWNSWNVWAASVDAAKVRAAADAMVSSGLASHGFQFVNIDDAWPGKRDANGEITSNEKFPDMKALADYVHSKGLKIGIYSSPGPRTCEQKFEGSYQHEEQDARTYAKWGFDYLKYDWCSYSEVVGRGVTPTLEQMKHPYEVMRDALAKVDRDIVYSLCQYGMGDVWEWGASVGGNLWRTTGDITDTWASMSNIGFNQGGHETYAGSSHWNDPDMLVVGRLGWGPNIHPTRLTPNEQITHITLWSLLAAPLLIGADMSRLDKFTLDLLSNDEVLGVDQDPLGKAAGRTRKDGDVEVWARPLADGTTAVGLFNRGMFAASARVTWADLGLSGSLPVRNLWEQKDLGSMADGYTAQVPRHGAILIKVGSSGPPRRSGRHPTSDVPATR